MRQLSIGFVALSSCLISSLAVAEPAAPEKAATCDSPARKTTRPKSIGDQRHAAQTLDIKTRRADGSTREKSESIKFNSDGSGQSKSLTEVRSADGSSSESSQKVKVNSDGSSVTRTESGKTAADGTSVSKSKTVVSDANGVSSTQVETRSETR